MTNEKVMFEFPVGSGQRWDAFDCLTQALYIPNTVKESKQSVFLMGRGDKRVEYTFDIMLEAGEFLEDFYKAKHTAQLKAQGWRSPDDQRPFCMESARELGVKLQEKGLYLFTLRKFLRVSKTILFKTVSGVYKNGLVYPVKLSYSDNLCPWGTDDFVSFSPLMSDGFQDPHETRRLEALGVKRYEKGGK